MFELEKHHSFILELRNGGDLIQIEIGRIKREKLQFEYNLMTGF